MAAINFPNSPTPGDTFTASNKTWVYLDGKWTLPSVDANGLVTTISSATSGQFLKWNGSAWVNDTIDLGADTAGSFVASLVAGTGVSLANNSGEAATPTIALDATLDNLSNVTVPSPTTNDVLQWNGTAWVNVAASTVGATNLNGLSDVVISTPEEFQTLEYDGTNWVNTYSSVVSYVRNAEATTLTTGTVVYLFGSTGDHATVKRADNDSDVTSSKTIGVVGVSIPASENGPVVTRGYVDGIDLSVGYTAGDILWLGEDGGFTKTKPTAPEHLVFIGAVIRATSNGIIYVATQNGYELDELHDVSITSLASGQFLKYNGSLWVNDAIDLGTDTTGSYVQNLVAGTGVTLTNNSGESATPTVAVDTSVIQARVTDVSDTEIGYLNGVTSAIQTQIDAKAPLASPTFTGTVSGVTKTMVGLGNVDDTSDASKPVSTAQQTALDLKANLASPTFTGTVTVPTPTNNTDAATKAYTDAIVTAAKIITAAGGDGTNGQALTTNGAGTLDFTTIVGTTEASIITAVGADGAAGSVLKTNGSGDLSFGDVALGTNTSGDYVASLVAGTGVTLTNNSGEGATPTVAIGQAVATNSNVTFNDLTVSGNLTVSGTTTSINTETVTVDDNIIVLNNNATGAPTVDAGIEVERGSSTNVQLRWNETTDKWQFTNDGSTYTDLGAGGASISDTPPTSPVAGQVWFESDTAKTYVYYDSSWVEIGAGSNPAALNDVGDVTITSATNGQFLKWNGSAWVNDSIPTINTLDDVGDVTITSASSGQVLQWNGTAWVNAIGFSGNKQAILSSQIFG